MRWQELKMVRRMITIRSAGAPALALLAAACGEKQNRALENREPTTRTPVAPASDQVYSGTGTVRSITGDQVTITHGPIPELGWPAMTMAYTVPPDIAAGVRVGARVDFSFKKNGSVYVLTSVKPQ